MLLGARVPPVQGRIVWRPTRDVDRRRGIRTWAVMSCPSGECWDCVASRPPRLLVRRAAATKAEVTILTKRFALELGLL
jgi:hypothetical protein